MATLETCLMGSKECPQLVTTSSAQKTIRKGGVDVPVLFVAAENGLVKTFEAILKNGGSIDVTDTLGNNINEYLAAVMAKMVEGRNFDNYIEKITPIKMLIGKIYNEKRSSGKNIRVNNPFGANTPAPAPHRVNAGASANPFTPAEAGAGAVSCCRRHGWRAHQSEPNCEFASDGGVELQVCCLWHHVWQLLLTF